MSEYWSGSITNVLGTAPSHISVSTPSPGTSPIGATSAAVTTLNIAGAYGPPVPNLSAYLASKPSHTVHIRPHPVLSIQTRWLSPSWVGGFPPPEGKLIGGFVVWTATEEAGFLAGQFVWASWDFQKLSSLRDNILSKSLFVTSFAE
ncbi:hypothetical protein BJY01DRAFT_248084 [Aspergillus pseudoustus]|uniref:Uncharacterized protein n=1 Tax=Aspergillus pseudoustus TaxID=1810923 RepID=A0ABR4JX16_9EURO